MTEHAGVREKLLHICNSKDIRALFKVIYDDYEEMTPTDSQAEMCRRIIYPDGITDRQLLINAYTRWGKTVWVTRAIAALLRLRSGAKAAFVGPKMNMLRQMRSAMADAIMNSTILQGVVELTATTEQRLKKESTKKRQTFSNGSEYVFLSAYNPDDLLSHGADIVIKEEDTKLSREAQQKSARMLGDNPENYQEIRLFNPVSRNTDTYDKWADREDYGRVHVDVDQGIREGRTTEAYKQKMRREMTDTEYQVMMESVFPDDTEKGLLGHDDLQSLQERRGSYDGVDEVRIGVDVAGHGQDKTVVTTGEMHGNHYRITNCYVETKTDKAELKNHIHHQSIPRERDKADTIKVVVDAVGEGIGVYEELRTLYSQADDVHVIKAMYGNNPSREEDRQRYSNEKARNYWHLKTVVEEGRLWFDDVNAQPYVDELLKVETEFTRSGKIRVVDPSKSPDYADSLVYTLWRDNTVSFGFA